MIEHLPSLQQLIKQLQSVPYVASKNLYRIAQHFLEMNDQEIDNFCSALKTAKKQLIQCITCCAWREETKLCLFCSPKRDLTTICVVETWHDLCALEKIGCYHGSYHVLGGSLYPLQGIGPENLTINALLDRINSNCLEIILAMNQTPEGEATAVFIARKLQGKNLKITCLARGIPVGSSLEYMDRITLHKAVLERRNF